MMEERKEERKKGWMDQHIYTRQKMVKYMYLGHSLNEVEREKVRSR